MKKIVLYSMAFFVLGVSLIFAGEEAFVVSRLKTYLKLRYNERDVVLAYNEYYPEEYKSVLAKTRGVNDAKEYYASKPSVDFALSTEITKVYEVRFNGDVAKVKAKAVVSDHERGGSYSSIQTYTMRKEGGRWVYSFYD